MSRCCTRWGGGRWKSQNRKNVYLSPYVEESLNSKVIKSSVPEQRSRKCFSCFFEIPMFYVYIYIYIWTLYVHFAYPYLAMVQWEAMIYKRTNLSSLEKRTTLHFLVGETDPKRTFEMNISCFLLQCICQFFHCWDQVTISFIIFVTSSTPLWIFYFLSGNNNTSHELVSFKYSFLSNMFIAKTYLMSQSY